MLFYLTKQSEDGFMEVADTLTFQSLHRSTLLLFCGHSNLEERAEYTMHPRASSIAWCSGRTCMREGACDKGKFRA